MEKILITGHTLTLEELAAVCRDNAPVALAPEAKQRILESRQVVDMLVDEAAVVYGITTGFGKFSDVTITQDECRQLQRNLIVTHAVGAGDPFPRDVARGIMLLRVNNLAKGFSGTRLELVETLVAMLNRGVTPVIPQKGSLGASGDLAPLSHMVLPMLGLGQAEYEGEVLPGDVAMERAGIPTVELVAKEGLALINGTQAMTSVGALVGDGNGMALDRPCTWMEAATMADSLILNLYDQQNAGSLGLLWKAEGNGNTLYLLGSIHTDRNNVYPFHKQLRDIILNAEQVSFELDFNDQAGVAELSAMQVYSDGTTLADHISPELYQVVVDTGEKLGIQESVLCQYKPWALASTFQSLATQWPLTCMSTPRRTTPALKSARWRPTPSRGAFLITSHRNTSSPIWPAAF